MVRDTGPERARRVKAARLRYFVQDPQELGISARWRRGGDSNPRDGIRRLHDFQSCSFGLSDTSPKTQMPKGDLRETIVSAESDAAISVKQTYRQRVTAK